jgi:hypothetical protein
MALILDGTLGLTVPAANIGNLTLSNSSISGLTATGISAVQQLPTGSVLQVVQATYSTQTAIASTSYTDIGLSVSITPKFSTSKILILASVLADIQKSVAGGIGGGISIVRNSTTVWAPNPNGGSQPYTWYISSGVEFTQMMNLNYLDNPATTSAITYKIQGASYTTNNSSAVYFQAGNSSSNIILMEIAG